MFAIDVAVSEEDVAIDDAAKDIDDDEVAAVTVIGCPVLVHVDISVLVLFAAVISGSSPTRTSHGAEGAHANTPKPVGEGFIKICFQEIVGNFMSFSCKTKV